MLELELEDIYCQFQVPDEKDTTIELASKTKDDVMMEPNRI